jgi:hypothetical protein
MTEAMLALTEQAENESDADVLRQMIQFIAQRLMDFDVETLCGAAGDLGHMPADIAELRCAELRPGSSHAASAGTARRSPGAGNIRGRRAATRRRYSAGRQPAIAVPAARRAAQRRRQRCAANSAPSAVTASQNMPGSGTVLVLKA